MTPAFSRHLSSVAVILAFAGLFVAGVLSAGHILDLPVPCGRGRGCVQVAAHPSSRILGVPIAYIGVTAYTFLVLLALRAPVANGARVSLVLFSGIGTILSGILLGYAHRVIQATCLWCVASGVALTLLFIVSLAMLRTKGALVRTRPSVVWSLAFVTAIGIGLEAGLMQKRATTPPIPAERLAGIPVDQLIDPAKSLGPDNPAITVIVFADFWCSACRKVYGSLVAYQNSNPDKVRLVYRHLPLFELRGHRFSGTAAALSEMAGEKHKFWQFAHALHEQQTQLAPANYLQLMEKLGFDQTEVETRMNNPDDPAILRVRRDMELAEKLGIAATPTFIVVIPGHRPVSANQRLLPRILNSPAVRAALANHGTAESAQ